MASKNRDIRLQALTLGTDVIPIGGEGVAVRVAYGTLGEVVRGNATSIKTQPGQPDGVLTIAVYPEDAAAPILRRIAQTRRLPGVASTPLPGSFVNTLIGETVSWVDAHLTGAGDSIGGPTSEVITYTFSLIDVQVAQVLP